MALALPHSFPNGYLQMSLPIGTKLFRIHHRDRDPIWFGPPVGSPAAYRFDAPSEEFRTLYVAERLAGAFVETVLRRANRIVSQAFVDQRAWSTLESKREFKVAQVYGEGLVYHGVTGDICAGDDYRPSQTFALQLFQEFDDLDGLAYRARHNNDEICFALFDRVLASDLEVCESCLFQDDPTTASDLMSRHGAVWDTSPGIPPLARAG